MHSRPLQSHIGTHVCLASKRIRGLIKALLCYCKSLFLTQDIMLSKSTRSDFTCIILYFFPFAKLTMVSPVAKRFADFLRVTVWPTFKAFGFAGFLLLVEPGSFIF